MPRQFTHAPEEIIIIGAGMAGVSLAYMLAKEAKAAKKPVHITVIEQTPEEQSPNPLGSSYGKARITRLATAEGKQFIPLAKRSQAIIHDIEHKTGQLNQLHLKTGGLIIGPAHNAWPAICAQFAEENHIPYTLTPADKHEPMPALTLHHEETVYHEPSMGMFLPKPCHQTLIDLAKKAGVDFHFNESFIDTLHSDSGLTTVKTNKAHYKCRHLIVCTGPWMQSWLNKALNVDVSAQLSVHPCFMYTFKVADNARHQFKPEACPVLIWQTAPTEAFVFFPDISHDGTVQFALFPIADMNASTLTPEQTQSLTPALTPDEIYEKFIQLHFNGITNQCVKLEKFPFTMNKGERFVYDHLPDQPNIKIVDIGSAHGYKHALGFAEQIAKDIILEQPDPEFLKNFGGFVEAVIDPHLKLSK
jgi:sarcosine oxidase